MKLKINHDYKNIREYLEKFLFISKKNLHILNMSKNAIFLNNVAANLYSKIKLGDILYINVNQLNLKQSNYIENHQQKIDIEFEDDYLLVAYKPVAIKTHPNDIDKEDDTLVNYLKCFYPYIEPIHRLDIDTSGLVIFAKNPLIKSKLDAMLEKKEISRYYTALVKNKLNKQSIKTYVDKDRHHPNKMTVSNKGKIAITNILDCKKRDNCYQLTIALETGRTHQIRVHLAHLNHPILGDKLYSKDYNKYERMYLGAFKVEFIHPITLEKISVESKHQYIF